MGSRRASTEGFEDAMESFDLEQTVPAEFGADYSSYAFSLRTPRNVASQKAGRAVIRAKPEAMRITTFTAPTSGRFSMSVRQSTSQRAYAPALRGGIVRDTVSYAAELMVEQEPETVAPLSPSRQEKASRQEHAATPGRAAPEIEGNAAAAMQNEEPESSQRMNRRDLKLHETETPSRAVSQERSLAVARKNPISRYASVPAFSAADQLRIDRFKVSSRDGRLAFRAPGHPNVCLSLEA